MYASDEAMIQRDSASARAETARTTPDAEPHYRRERERLALLEAEIAQTCYQLSRLRGEHRRIRARLALLEATMVDFMPTCAAAD